MRLKHKASGRNLFFVKLDSIEHATAYNILQVMAKNAQVGDVLMLVGDFNANAASRTLQSLWSHLHAVKLVLEWLTSLWDKRLDLVEAITRRFLQSSQLGKKGQIGRSAQHYSGRWYPGLTPYSTPERFQEVVHQNNPEKCPLPCSTVGSRSRSLSDASMGTSFSVSVLENAKGSDGCLLEPQTEYEVDGWSQIRKGVADPRVCCQLCQQNQGCKAWLWTEWEDSAKDFACILKGGTVKGRKFKDGTVSGLPKREAVKEAEMMMAKAAQSQS
eukprot:g6265.t1